MRKSQKQKIFEHIQLVGQATVAETAKALGLPRGSVGRAVSDMRDAGELRAAGSGVGKYARAVIYKTVGSFGPQERAAHGTVRAAIYHTLLAAHGPMSSVDISKIDGLNRTTVSSALNRLAAQGLVEIVGKKTRPVTYQLKESAPFEFGVKRKVPKLRTAMRANEEKTTESINTAAQTARNSQSFGGGPFGLMAAQLGAGA